MSGGKLLLIDGDGLVYRCGFAVEKTQYLVVTDGSHKGGCFFYDSYKEALAFGGLKEDLWSRKRVEPEENALALVKTCLGKIIERFPDYEDVRIVIAPTAPTFRDRLATLKKYKGNRDAATKPAHYDAIRTYLISYFGAVLAVDEEADDRLSRDAASARALGQDYIVVSLDKDLDQIPGKHFNWVVEKSYSIGKKEAGINLYSQILSGDTTDNIPGLKGIGPVKARQMLEGATSVRDCWKIVLDAYRGQFGESGEAIALENARLVYLRQKEGELFEPPKTQ